MHGAQKGRDNGKLGAHSPSPQGRTTAQSMHPVSLSDITSPPLMTCVRRSRTTHSRPVLNTGIVGGVCRSGLSPPVATPTRKWPSILPALPQPGSSLTTSQPSLCTCCSFLSPLPLLPTFPDPSGSWPSPSSGYSFWGQALNFPCCSGSPPLHSTPDSISTGLDGS